MLSLKMEAFTQLALLGIISFLCFLRTDWN